ncbi:unnamed protein product [Rhizophagus irregularis]|nr:unnamed protein product [Rhizophagus irregularis]
MSQHPEGSNTLPPVDTSNNLQAAFEALAAGSAPSEVQIYAANEVTRLQTELAQKDNAYNEMAAFYATATEQITALEKEKTSRRTRSQSPLFRLHNKGPTALDDYDEMEMEHGSSRPVRPIATPRNKGLELLSNTKAMKTCVRNLLQKLARVRVRLVKVSEVKNSNNLARAKKFYQYRLVSEDNSEIKIFEDNRKQLDTDIATCTMNILVKDLDEQITAIKEQINSVGPQLRKELEDAALHALSSPDLSDTEKESLRTQWDSTITYNMDWLEKEITKLKQSPAPKVSKGDVQLEEFLKSCIDFALIKYNIGTSQAPQPPVDDNAGQEVDHSQPQEASRPRTQKFQGFQKDERSKKSSKKGKSKGEIEGKGKGRKEARSQTSRIPEKRIQALPSAEEKTGWQKQKQQKKVFVNVATQRNISIPSYVFSTLNLGANFQIISTPSLQTRRKNWSGIASQTKEIIRNSDSFNNNNNSLNNIMDAVQSVMINDPNYFNKVVASKQNFKQAVKQNKLVQNVFDFLNDNELMCILADKNLGLTIIDKSWYIDNMLKHFNRLDVFELVASDPFEVKELHASVWLQTNLRKYCSLTTSLELTRAIIDPHAEQLPLAYGLIKLHKSPYKLRIITPVVEWINVKAAVEVVRRLGDYVKLFNHVLTNSTELVRELDGLMSYDFVLASFDVSDMYNSIGQEECIRRIEVLAKEYGWWTDKNEPYWRSTMVLIEFVFHTSYVGFGGRVYKQKRGLPMGSPLSPVLANLYMVQLEDTVIPAMRTKNIHYYRYLDDVLFFHSSFSAPIPSDVAKFRMEERMSHFCKTLTQFSDDSIIFERTGTAHNPGQYVEYLDLKLEIALDNRMVRNKVLRLSVYDKPTNLHIYTDPSTFYPFHYVYNWIQGENIRLIRNSSSPVSYERSLYDFKKFLLRRKYSQDLIERFCSLNYYGDRNELLAGAKPHKTRKNAREELGNNSYIAVRNSGSRPLLTSAIHVVDSFVNTLEISERRLVPVVSQGKTIISVMNQAKKSLAGYQPR